MKKLKLNLDEIDVESFEIPINRLEQTENDLVVMMKTTLSDPTACDTCYISDCINCPPVGTIGC